jgi:predicted acetyltransferase
MVYSVKLVKPIIDLNDEYISFYEDWKESAEDMVPWVIERDPTDFQNMVDFLYSQDSEAKINTTNLVPHSTYWLLNEEKKIVGAVNIRHRLNQKLLNSGGHIGYGIRPSQRRKGYATTLLTLALKETKELGLEKVLVVCDKSNIGSERTIIKNGGVFESEYIEDNGNIVRRFWINL